MSLKYVYFLGSSRLPGYEPLYPLAHMPLDNVILGYLRTNNGAPMLSAAWSRLREYGEYLAFQDWVRTTFAPDAPLAVEFRLHEAALRRSGLADHQDEGEVVPSGGVTMPP